MGILIQITIHGTWLDMYHDTLICQKFLLIYLLNISILNGSDVLPLQKNSVISLLGGFLLLPSCCKTFMQFLCNKSLFLYWIRWSLMVSEYHDTNAWLSKTIRLLWFAIYCHTSSHPYSINWVLTLRVYGHKYWHLFFQLLYGVFWGEILWYIQSIMIWPQKVVILLHRQDLRCPCFPSN